MLAAHYQMSGAERDLINEIALLRAQLVGIKDYAEAVEKENNILRQRIKELDKMEQGALP